MQTLINMCKIYLIIAGFICLQFRIAEQKVFHETHVTLPTIKSKPILPASKNDSAAESVLYVPLEAKGEVLLYELIPSLSIKYPVYIHNGNRRRHSHYHTNGNQYVVRSIDFKEYLSGQVILHNNTIEGIIPLNGSHYGFIYPTNRSVDHNGEHIVDVIPITTNISDTIALHRAYAKANRSPYLAKNIELAAELADEKLLKRKRRSSAGSETVFLPSRNKNAVTKTGPFVMQLYLCVDSAYFNSYNRDKNATIDALQNTLAYVNLIFNLVDLTIIPAAVEIWEQNPDSFPYSSYDPKTHDRITPVLENFTRYVKNSDIKVEYDCAHLLTASDVRYETAAVGVSQPGRVCHQPYLCSSLSVRNTEDSNTAVVGLIMAHELGHSLGIGHINAQHNCYCRDQSTDCLMYPEGYTVNFNLLHWSNCSAAHLREFLDRPKHCLRPTHKRMPSRMQYVVNKIAGWGPRCGNSIIEAGEQCDCGGKISCENNKCCNPQTCQLYENATCAYGQCCDKSTCRLHTAATVCRRASDECDLPEFCNGVSNICPEDVSVANFKRCDQDRGYCFYGTCASSDIICKRYFGPQANNGGRNCYTFNAIDSDIMFGCPSYQVNSGFPQQPASNHRHCGNEVNWRCGRIVCRLPETERNMNSARPSFIAKFSHFNSNTRGRFHPLGDYCVALKLMPTEYSRDLGLAPNGIPCTLNKTETRICYNNMCRSPNSFKVAPKMKCYNGATLNSKGNCHCQPGYAPPDCKQLGFGGSVDSGPVTNDMEEDSSLLLGVCLAITILFAFVMLGLVIRFKDRIAKNLPQINCLSTKFIKPDLICKYSQAAMHSSTKGNSAATQVEGVSTLVVDKHVLAAARAGAISSPSPVLAPVAADAALPDTEVALLPNQPPPRPVKPPSGGVQSAIANLQPAKPPKPTQTAKPVKPPKPPKPTKNFAKPNTTNVADNNNDSAHNINSSLCSYSPNLEHHFQESPLPLATQEEEEEVEVLPASNRAENV